MNEFDGLWKKFAKSKEYREHFVAAQVKRGIPVQIRQLLRDQGISQSELAERANLTQGVVSRAADPDYGNLTLNTIIRIAAGFDVGFIGKFVPFSDLGRWFLDLSDEEQIEVFESENARFERKATSPSLPKSPGREVLSATGSQYPEAMSAGNQSAGLGGRAFTPGIASSNNSTPLLGQSLARIHAVQPRAGGSAIR